jgi:hypothetical protein
MPDTTTTHYGLVKPEVGASNNTWGGKLNTNLDTIDSTLDTLDGEMTAAAAAILDLEDYVDNSAPPAGTANNRFLTWATDTWVWATIAVTDIADGLLTFAKLASSAIGSNANYHAATADKLTTMASLWSDNAVLTDATTIAVDMAAGMDFGGASNAALALSADRALGAPSNVRNGKKGILWFGAAGATRTLTLNAAWKLMKDVETGPYAIPTTEELGVAYAVRGSTVWVTGILRGVV